MKELEAARLRSAAIGRLNDRYVDYKEAVEEWRTRAVSAVWKWFDSKEWRKKAGQSPPSPPPPPDLRIQLDLDDGMGK